MSTELAVVGDSAVNPLSYLGYEADEPVKPVRLSLIQPNNASAEDGTIAGRFLDNQSNFQYEDLNIVVLEIRGGRVAFESPDPGSKVLCRSEGQMGKINGVITMLPVVNDDLQRQDFGRGCAKCPAGAWKKINGRNIKPQCGETLSILAVQMETGFTYRINGKGTSVPIFKDLKETIRKTYMATAAKGVPMLPTEMYFKLSSVKVKDGSKTWYIPKLSAPNRVPEQYQEDITNAWTRLVVNKGVDYSEDEPVDPVSAVLSGEYVEPIYEAA